MRRHTFSLRLMSIAYGENDYVALMADCLTMPCFRNAITNEISPNRLPSGGTTDPDSTRRMDVVVLSHAAPGFPLDPIDSLLRCAPGVELLGCEPVSLTSAARGCRYG